MPTTVIASAKTINPIRAELLTAKHLTMQAFATCTNDIASQHYYQKELLVPRHHNGARPLCGGFRQKKAAPLTEAASSKSIY
jgi:hypothetical protein